MIGTAPHFGFARISGELDSHIDTQPGDYLSTVATDLTSTAKTSWVGLGLVIMLMTLPFLFVAWLFR